MGDVRGFSQVVVGGGCWQVVVGGLGRWLEVVVGSGRCWKVVVGGLWWWVE